MLGSIFTIGDCVAKAIDFPRSGSIEIAKVTKVEGEKIYLCESRVAVVYPGRLVNLSRLPGRGHWRSPETFEENVDQAARLART